MEECTLTMKDPSGSSFVLCHFFPRTMSIIMVENSILVVLLTLESKLIFLFVGVLKLSQAPKMQEETAMWLLKSSKYRDIPCLSCLARTQSTVLHPEPWRIHTVMSDLQHEKISPSPQRIDDLRTLPPNLDLPEDVPPFGHKEIFIKPESPVCSWSSSVLFRKSISQGRATQSANVRDHRQWCAVVYNIEWLEAGFN